MESLIKTGRDEKKLRLLTKTENRRIQLCLDIVQLFILENFEEIAYLKK